MPSQRASRRSLSPSAGSEFPYLRIAVSVSPYPYHVFVHHNCVALFHQREGVRAPLISTLLRAGIESFVHLDAFQSSVRRGVVAEAELGAGEKVELSGNVRRAGSGLDGVPSILGPGAAITALCPSPTHRRRSSSPLPTATAAPCRQPKRKRRGEKERE
uniref:Uncharacterized protein n=1 Tax=Oryza punctata TaxID=4537 RepID=A0A0E0JGD6_ORYPU